MSQNTFTQFTNNSNSNWRTNMNNQKTSTSEPYVPPGKKNQPHNKFRIYENNKEFEVKEQDFPSLDGKNKVINNNNCYSNVINYKNAAENGSKVELPQKPRKMVSLVNKSKKKNYNVEEEYESDNERREDYKYMETSWFPYMSEEEDYYTITEEEYKRRENDYDY